uniref:Transcriptional regulator, AsnC family n=1 Tax=Parastrongyloides trichosuri TaxID=131310 RepID=A0A0N5A285_PARTI
GGHGDRGRAGHGQPPLCPFLAGPSTQHQGLSSGAEDRHLRGCSHSGDRRADRSFASLASVWAGGFGGGADAGVQGHHPVAGRLGAVELQRHAARRRLDRDAPGERRRRRHRHRPAHGQGAELRQDHRLHPHLALD